MTDHETAEAIARKFYVIANEAEITLAGLIEFAIATARLEGFEEARELAADVAENHSATHHKVAPPDSGCGAFIAGMIRAIQPAAQGKPDVTSGPVAAPKEPCPTCKYCGLSGEHHANCPDSFADPKDRVYWFAEAVDSPPRYMVRGVPGTPWESSSMPSAPRSTGSPTTAGRARSGAEAASSSGRRTRTRWRSRSRSPRATWASGPATSGSHGAVAVDAVTGRRQQ